MEDAPFKIGDRVHPDQLLTWNYAGLSGKPGRNQQAIRRFTKGDWTLGVRAHRNHDAVTHVVSICTLEEDAAQWQETRDRLTRHRR